MNLLKERPLVSGLVLGLLIGILLGWFGIGWGLWPVEYSDYSPSSDYVTMTAELFGQNRDVSQAQARMRNWPNSTTYICQMADLSQDALEKQKLEALAVALSPGAASCQEVLAAPAEEGPSLGNRLALLCGVILLAAFLAAGLFLFITRRGARKEGRIDELPEGEPTASLMAPGGRTIPLAQFPTEFNIGHDTYDDSFSIETATGEFLGECGMGISESIGIGDPKKVTAFEIWLFDKNDIRTVTKVIMSEHAYYDDALRAKLAPKGEAALAKPGETIVLETASLIINARVIEMEYGTGELPPQSFFNRLVVELAAWAKETEEMVTSPGALAEADMTDFEL